VGLAVGSSTFKGRGGNIANILIDVALEVIDSLVATKKHEILLLSRKV
jgi:hypothetical protein